jgi:4-hydroxy-tetrahydrodipicolinate synthase
MAAKTNFRGSFTALVTPFKNGSVDEAAFRALVSWQIAEGTNGLVPVGTTGESPTLSHDEHKQVVEWCINEAAGRVPGPIQRVRRSSSRSMPRKPAPMRCWW